MSRQKPEITSLLILLLLLLLPFKVLALNQESGDKTHQMGEIVVTATRSLVPEDAVAADITVITRKDMEKLAASSVAEVLQYIPGIYVELNGGLGSESSGRIQGSESRHVAVYQDGVPLNQLANPTTDLSYIPLDTIDRIEVYKGAASSAWGSALGGVINIISKEPDLNHPVMTHIQTSYGEFETRENHVTLNGTMDAFGYLVSFTHDESDGFMKNTPYKQEAFYTKLKYEWDETARVDFVYSYDKGRNGDPLPPYTDFWDDIHRKRVYQRLLFETSPVDSLVLSLEGRHHEFDSRIDDVFSDFSLVYSDYKDEIWGISGRLTWDSSSENMVSMGFDEDWGKYYWNNYGKEYTTRNWAFYTNDTLTMEPFSFNAGIRYDNNRDFGYEISPSAGAVFRFSGNKALVRAQVAKGFSAPPAAWVHDPRFGDPDLAPELAMNYQLGSEIQPFPFLNLALNIFQSDIKDLIRFNLNSERFENIDKATRRGIEGTIRLDFNTAFTLSLGGSFVDAKNDMTGQVIKDIPRTLYNITAAYSGEWMSHSLSGRFIDHNSSYPETRDRVFVFDYLVKVKLPLPIRYGNLKLFGAIYNLFNTTYLYREMWPKPDRWVKGGISYEIALF